MKIYALHETTISMLPLINGDTCTLKIGITQPSWNSVLFINRANVIVCVRGKSPDAKGAVPTCVLWLRVFTNRFMNLKQDTGFEIGIPQALEILRDLARANFEGAARVRYYLIRKYNIEDNQLATELIWKDEMFNIKSQRSAEPLTKGVPLDEDLLHDVYNLKATIRVDELKFDKETFSWKQLKTDFVYSKGISWNLNICDERSARSYGMHYITINLMSQRAYKKTQWRFYAKVLIKLKSHRHDVSDLEYEALYELDHDKKNITVSVVPVDILLNPKNGYAYKDSTGSETVKLFADFVVKITVWNPFGTYRPVPLNVENAMNSLELFIGEKKLYVCREKLGSIRDLCHSVTSLNSFRVLMPSVTMTGMAYHDVERIAKASLGPPGKCISKSNVEMLINFAFRCKIKSLWFRCVKFILNSNFSKNKKEMLIAESMGKRRVDIEKMHFF